MPKFASTSNTSTFLTVHQNIERLKYQLHLHGLSPQELAERISEKRVHPIRAEDILAPEVKLSHLKKVDALFNKGIHYYLDDSPPPQSPSSSVFFRKQSFHSPLNFRDRFTVNQFEERAQLISAWAKLSNLKFNRLLPVYQLQQEPSKAANELREKMGKVYSRNLKKHLENLIRTLAEQNVLVMEYVEHPNRKEKTSVDGFFLGPHLIVLKRQKYYRREIFTLAHELGHYLLNEEEVESVEDYQNGYLKKTDKVETWCNEFAFHLLGGSWVQDLESLDKASPQNDYHHQRVDEIVEHTNLSKLAIYTRLLFLNKISRSAYQRVKKELLEQIEQDAQRRKEEREKNDAPLRAPKPIHSPLLERTLLHAYHRGIVAESEVAKQLNLKPEKLQKVLI